MAISIAITLLSWQKEGQVVIDHLFITPYKVPLSDVWYREPWRLVTPIFLHFNVLHILFNMLMLLQLGGLIERIRGSWRLALFVLAIAVPSNVAQDFWSGPNFGGMSGVVYGLFGYIWMKSRFDLGSGFYLPQNTVIWMIGWFVLCLTGQVGDVANVVHGVGLLVGMLLGFWPSFWRRMQ